MGTHGPGRRRIPNREKLTAEDDALDQIAREAEARLAAKRAARAEAREIRMKELERQQKEMSDEEERMSVGSRGSLRVEERPDRDRDFVDKGSRTASTLSATTLASLGGPSSRRGSCDTSFSVEMEASIRDIKDSLMEMEEKYRKAMVSNAQLHNEKAALMYQVETLREDLGDMEELLWEARRQCDERTKEYEREHDRHATLQFQFKEIRETLKLTEDLLTKHGVVLTPKITANGDFDKAEDDVGAESVAHPGSEPHGRRESMLGKVGEHERDGMSLCRGLMFKRLPSVILFPSSKRIKPPSPGRSASHRYRREHVTRSKLPAGPRGALLLCGRRFEGIRKFHNGAPSRRHLQGLEDTPSQAIAARTGNVPGSKLVRPRAAGYHPEENTGAVSDEKHKANGRRKTEGAAVHKAGSLEEDGASRPSHAAQRKGSIWTQVKVKCKSSSSSQAENKHERLAGLKRISRIVEEATRQPEEEPATWQTLQAEVSCGSISQNCNGSILEDKTGRTKSKSKLTTLDMKLTSPAKKKWKKSDVYPNRKMTKSAPGPGKDDAPPSQPVEALRDSEHLDIIHILIRKYLERGGLEAKLTNLVPKGSLLALEKDNGGRKVSEQMSDARRRTSDAPGNREECLAEGTEEQHDVSLQARAVCNERGEAAPGLDPELRVLKSLTDSDLQKGGRPPLSPAAANLSGNIVPAEVQLTRLPQAGAVGKRSKVRILLDEMKVMLAPELVVLKSQDATVLRDGRLEGSPPTAVEEVDSCEEVVEEEREGNEEKRDVTLSR